MFEKIKSIAKQIRFIGKIPCNGTISVGQLVVFMWTSFTLGFSCTNLIGAVDNPVQYIYYMGWTGFSLLFLHFGTKWFKPNNLYQ